ncbi:MAG: hypothetical protein V4598_09915 [Bdellovibrionota bacterium]
MRFQLIVLMFLSANAFSASDKEMDELFRKYDSVMIGHKVELIDEVFTRKFLESAGGKKEFSEGVKELPKSPLKTLAAPKISWKKGLKDELWLAKRAESSDKKNGKDVPSGNQFIIVKENGKLKIDGTMSDAE